MRPLTARLAAIEARLQAATPGPWTLRYLKCNIHSRCPGHHDIQMGDGRELFTAPLPADQKSDAELIAHAPDDLRLLLALARRSVEALERTRDLWEIALDTIDGYETGLSVPFRHVHQPIELIDAALADLARMGELPEPERPREE